MCCCWYVFKECVMFIKKEQDRPNSSNNNKNGWGEKKQQQKKTIPLPLSEWDFYESNVLGRSDSTRNALHAYNFKPHLPLNFYIMNYDYNSQSSLFIYTFSRWFFFSLFTKRFFTRMFRRWFRRCCFSFSLEKSLVYYMFRVKNRQYTNPLNVRHKTVLNRRFHYSFFHSFSDHTHTHSLFASRIEWKCSDRFSFTWNLDVIYI